jgi:predicted TIM-barrel fold metal-dependent hydrolase
VTIDGRVVDADAHINEDLTAWTGLAEARPGWVRAGRSGGRTVALVDGKLYPRQDGPGCGVPVDSAVAPACRPGALDLQRRISDLDSEGIDVQVLYGGLVIGVTGYEDTGLAVDVAHAYNDWLLRDVCRRFPGRLAGIAVLPLQDVRRAVEEMRRAVGMGAVGVTVPPVVGRRTLDDPALREVFEAAESLGVAVGVHSAPGMNIPLPGADLFANYAQVHLVSFPVDQMVAFTALALGGVFDAFPRLRVAFLEAGVGWVPYFLSRAQEHKDKRAELLPGLKTDLRELVARGQCWFSFECEDEFLGTYVEHLGADSVVYASDYPHWDSDFPGTVAEARARAETVGPGIAEKVLGANASRLYGLPVGAVA